MSLKTNIVSSIVIFMTVFFSFTQTEEEVKVKADDLFKNKQYIEATPLYLRLLSLQPRSYEYSYKYGTCLLFNSNSKQDAIRYLTYSIKNSGPIPEAHFFLGKAYHLNYQFNDAISEYKNYISKTGNKGEYAAESNRNIAMCENGKNLLTTLTDVIVRKKTEIKQSDFFRLYDLSAIGGSIIIAVDFQTKNDKKYNHKPVVHISPNMENVYFSSYGDGNNLDIYVVRKLPGGKFGIPQKISGGVNTPFDEDFPYMHPNGRELYFSSKGHNSMGGYDIFRAKYDPDNNTFGEVSNVDFAISSPDDDLLYVVDRENKNAYFSSTRQSQDGKVVVYQVAVERIPIQLAIVKGAFNSSVFPNSPKMTVEVFDKTNGKKIGAFNTLKESSYLITFPKGGKYQYKISVDGSNEEFNIDVEIPYLKELRPLKQKMDHELVDNKERIRITNLFDERFEDAQSIVSQVLKERANLNVNEDQFDEEELEDQTKIQAVLAELKLNNHSVTEVGQLLERKSSNLHDTNNEHQIINAANGITLGLYNEILAIDNEIKTLVKEADASESNRRKELILTNAKELYVQRDEKLQKIQQIQKEAAEMKSTSVNSSSVNPQQLKQVSTQLNQLISEGKNTEIGKYLEQNKQFIQSVLSEQSESGSEVLLNKQNSIEAEMQRLQAIEQGNREEIYQLENEIASLEQQKEGVKEKFKQDIQDKIDVKKYQLEDTKSALLKVGNLISAEIEKRDENNKKLNTVHEIENYKGKPASEEDITKAKSLISDDKIKTLKSYIEANIAELSGKSADDHHPTAATKTIETYNNQSEEIHANQAWNDYEKQQRLLALNQEKKQELHAYVEELENNRSLDEETRKQQKSSTQKLIQELEQDHTTLKEAFDNTTKQEVAKLKTENMVAGIYPEYQQQKNAILANNNLSEVEKLEELNAIDKELSEKITTETRQLKSTQSSSLPNPLNKAKTELLENHQALLQRTVNDRTKEIIRLQNEQKLLATNSVENQINQISATADEKYRAGMNQLKEQENKNPSQKVRVISDLQKDLTTQKKELEKLLTNHPESNSINSKIEGIEEKLNELSLLLVNEQKALEEWNKQQNKEEITTPRQTVKTPVIIIEELQAAYSGNIKNDFEKKHTTTEEIDQTIQQLNDYKNNLKKQLETAERTESEQNKQAYREVINREIIRTDDRIKQLENEKQVIQQEIAQQNRTIITEEGTTRETVKTPVIIIEELQAAYSGNIQNDFEKKHTTTEEIDQTIQQLNGYKNNLKKQLETAERTENEQNKQAYREAIRLEINRTDNRIQQLENDKQAIQQEPATDNQRIENETYTNEQSATRKEDIESLLIQSGLSNKERKELSKELTTIKQEQAVKAVEEKKVHKTELEEYIASLEKESERPSTPLSAVYNNDVSRISSILRSEKNPLEQERLLDELIAKQEQYVNYLERKDQLRENIAVTESEEQARIYPQEQLDRRRRQAIIEIEELTLLKTEKQKLISETISKKEQETIRQEILAINEKEELIKRELAFIDSQSALYNKMELPLTLEQNKVTITYNEERQIASSEQYEAYAKAVAEKNELLNNYKILEKELIHNQKQLGLIREKAATSPNEERAALSSQKQEVIDNIRNISISLKDIEKELSNAEKNAASHLPTDSSEKMKFQNLVARGINPIKKSFVATALIPLSASGIEFNPATSSIPELKTIPVDIKTPMGLIYRVQVGAFARPIPEDHFKEFSPVSGELVENTTITRYMAGYFNSASNVVDAREKIRRLGYSDAFVVAYCDGKRISFGEARRMESRNECTAKGMNELHLEVATSIVQKLGIEDTSKTLKPVPEWSYNEAPGAAKAVAIEQFDNELLFYTIQVGVYNRPVNKERLLNLDPLYTLRLDNGQIRYSVGMFGDINTARQLEREIRNKGISDAFVTAYYQGKRITVEKAKTLIASGVKLYNQDTQPVETIREPIIPSVETITEVAVFTENKVLKKDEKPAERYIQFISKNTYSDYPKEELNRFNNKGTFHFDQTDRRIKSIFYQETEALPRIASFTDQLDTIYLSKSEVLKSNDSKVIFVLNTPSIPGDMNDWLTKFPYRKAYTRSENGIEIHIFDIRLEDAEDMKAMSELFGFPLIETQNAIEYERNNE